jgi:indolepyruvate ferredoxin oxidoreductase, beta subunit
MELNIIVAGIGGQGSILASHIIAEAAISANQGSDNKINVRVGETFGAAQRGGAVASHVRIGDDVYGPLVGKGKADIVLALEPLEGLRVGVPYLAENGIAILNSVAQQPVDVKIGAVEYPALEEITGALAKIGKGVVTLDANQLASEAGNAKTLSVVMLGAVTASGLLPFSEEVMLAAIKDRVPAKTLDVNLQAFELGKKAYQEAKAAAGF